MLQALPLAHSRLFHLVISHEADSTSSSTVIKQHPWVHPKHKQEHPKPFLA